MLLKVLGPNGTRQQALTNVMSGGNPFMDPL